MPDRPTVAVVTDMWPSRDQPHSGRFVAAETAALAIEFRQVVLVPKLVAPRSHRRIWGGSVEGWQRDWELPAGVRVVRYPMARVPKRGEAWARGTGARIALRAARERPALVHGHFLVNAGEGAARLARGSGVPLVLTAHGTDVGLLESMLTPRRVNETLAACADAARVIAVSDDLAGRLASLGVDRDSVEVVPMGIDERVFCIRDRLQARAKLGLDADASIVLFVGRVTEDKGALVLAEAVRTMADDVTAYAAGPIEIEAGPVRLLGTLAAETLGLWLAAADVMCLPSFAEGMPVSVAEALATGTPAVASAVGGITEQIRPGENGVLVEPGDASALAAALDSALRADWEPVAIRATSERFWWPNVARRLAAIYHEVQDGRTS
jgi:teichuronic acid biosynthesis glycosyltransferase TuaC